MATGDTTDFTSRLKALLPGGWFGDDTPVLDSVLQGIAASFADVYGLTAYARLQTRIASATDFFLDLISLDFFGGKLPRRPGEADASFRTRILAQLLLERGTRAGMIRALTLLTGRTPVIFEPQRNLDTGSYNSTAFYNYAGRYGSRLPAQFFVIAYRPAASFRGILRGYNNPEVAYNTINASYSTPALIAAAVTDQDILDLIDAVKPAGTLAWVRIES